MPFYKVVSCPVSAKAPFGYKGIYRCEPDYQEDDGKEIYDLWFRYVQYIENRKICGISSELSIEELMHFCRLLSEKRNVEYEVLCIDREKPNLGGARYYGVDVSTRGGYSMIGEGLFYENPESRDLEEIKRMNRFFETRLNQYGLFDSEEDAKLFSNVLADFRSRNLVEPEDTFIFHIAHIDAI